MKILFIFWLVTLLLMGCSQPDARESEESLPSISAEEDGAVTSLTDSQPLPDQERSILLAEEQLVQVTFTQEALAQIAQDLNDPATREKVLKIKPAIDWAEPDYGLALEEQIEAYDLYDIDGLTIAILSEYRNMPYTFAVHYNRYAPQPLYEVTKSIDL